MPETFESYKPTRVEVQPKPHAEPEVWVPATVTDARGAWFTVALDKLVDGVFVPMAGPTYAVKAPWIRSTGT